MSLFRVFFGTATGVFKQPPFSVLPISSVLLTSGTWLSLKRSFLYFYSAAFFLFFDVLYDCIFVHLPNYFSIISTFPKMSALLVPVLWVSSNIINALFPFNFDITFKILILGGISTYKCTWFGYTSPYCNCIPVILYTVYPVNLFSDLPIHHFPTIYRNKINMIHTIITIQ